MSDSEKLFAFNLLESRKSVFDEEFFAKLPPSLNEMRKDPIDAKISKFFLFRRDLQLFNHLFFFCL